MNITLVQSYSATFLPNIIKIGLRRR